jgi:hypothetical protein
MPRMATDENDLHEVVHRLEIVGDLGRQDVEALELEIRRLAKRNGVEILELRIEKESDDI